MFADQKPDIDMPFLSPHFSSFSQAQRWIQNTKFSWCSNWEIVIWTIPLDVQTEKLQFSISLQFLHFLVYTVLLLPQINIWDQKAAVNLPASGCVAQSVHLLQKHRLQLSLQGICTAKADTPRMLASQTVVWLVSMVVVFSIWLGCLNNFSKCWFGCYAEKHFNRVLLNLLDAFGSIGSIWSNILFPPKVSRHFEDTQKQIMKERVISCPCFPATIWYSVTTELFRVI